MIAATLLAICGAPAQIVPTAVRAQDQVERGRRLFTGEAALARGGPACAACHNVASVDFPAGGTMGPDLTNLAERIGPQGVETAVQTLYFPTMVPLYRAHPLTADEERALTAFLSATTQQEPQRDRVTIAFLGAAILGVAIMLAVTGASGRSRIRSVRLALLARAASTRKGA